MSDAAGRARRRQRPASRKKRWHQRAADELERELKRRGVRQGAPQSGLAARHRSPHAQSLHPRAPDRLAWAGAGGRLPRTRRSLRSAAAAPSSRPRQASQRDRSTLDADNLRERNHGRLRRHCSDELLMRQFLRRGVFTPSLQTALVDALDALQPAAGGNALLELAMTANSELEARFVVNALEMLAQALGKRARGGRLLAVGAGLAYDSVDGERVLPLPVDYLAWTGEVENSSTARVPPCRQARADRRRREPAQPARSSPVAAGASSCAPKPPTARGSRRTEAQQRRQRAARVRATFPRPGGRSEKGRGSPAAFCADAALTPTSASSPAPCRGRPAT